MTYSTSEFLSFDRDAIVSLFILDGSSIGISEQYAFCNEVYPDGSEVAWNGQSFAPIPIELSGEQRDTSNQLPTPTLKLGPVQDSGLQLLIASLVDEYQDMVGARIRHIQIRAQHLDAGSDPNPSAILADDLYVVRQPQKMNRLEYEWQLSVGNDLEGKQIPARILTNNCSWRFYREEGCGYTGAPIEDRQGNPLTPLEFAALTLTGTSLTGATFDTVLPGDAVVCQGLDWGVTVKSISTDKQTIILSKSGTNGTYRTWIARESCPRNILNCKRRFGVQLQGVVAPGSDIISSTTPNKGGFREALGAMVHADSLNAGLPVARRVIAVLPSASSYAITNMVFQNKRWIFTYDAASGLVPNTGVTVSGISPSVNLTYTVMSDSFGGTLAANEFAVNAVPISVILIVTTITTTTFTTDTPHQLTTGDRVFIDATGSTTLDGFKTVTVLSPTEFRISNGLTSYDTRGRTGFQTEEYLGDLLGTTILNDVAASNPWGFAYYAVDGPVSGSFQINDDRVQLDAPIHSSAIAGTYNLTFGGERMSGLLNFGGQPGAAIFSAS